MTIELTEKIDIITLSEETGRIYLNISDHLSWDSPDKRLTLQNKVNRYLAFIESGEMALNYPQSTVLNPTIHLICKQPPNPTDEIFLLQVREIIEEAGYSFDWKLFDPLLNQLIDNKIR